MTNPPQDLTADVVVIGAGLSGLTAARRLTEQGVSVIVLEANDRVGGRTVNVEAAPGVTTDGGGQWIGGKHTRMFALLEELGLSTFDTPTAGRSIYVRHRARKSYRGTIPPLKPLALADFAQAQTRLELMASTVPCHAPWEAKRADRWDGQTVGAWLDANCLINESRDLFTFCLTTMFGEDPHRISLLKVLHQIRTSGGLEFMFNTEHGAQESRISGGAQSVSLRIADELGHRLILNSPVLEVHQDAHGALVRSTGATVSCDRVIVAMCPADVDRIAFTPGLPTRRAALQRIWHNGTESKVFVVYDKPFWRDRGLNGSAITDLPLAHFVVDNSPADSSVGILLAFVGTAGGGAGHHWSDAVLDDPDKRNHALVKDLVHLFGADAANPVRIVEKNWVDEPWISGCVSTRAPGVMTGYTDAVIAPVGRIHWAGTEAAPEFEGYLEGAVRAAHRAVDEVFAHLPAVTISNRVRVS